MTIEASPFKEASWFHWKRRCFSEVSNKVRVKRWSQICFVELVTLKRRIVYYQIQSNLEPCTTAFVWWSHALCWDGGLDLCSQQPRACHTHWFRVEFHFRCFLFVCLFLTLPFAVIWNYGWNPCIKYWLFLPLMVLEMDISFLKCPILGIDSMITKVKWTKWSWKITKHSISRDLREKQSLRIHCGQSELCAARTRFHILLCQDHAPRGAPNRKWGSWFWKKSKLCKSVCLLRCCQCYYFINNAFLVVKNNQHVILS